MPPGGKMAISLQLLVRAHVRDRSEECCIASGAGESTLHFLAGLPCGHNTQCEQCFLPRSMIGRKPAGKVTHFNGLATKHDKCYQQCSSLQGRLKLSVMTSLQGSSSTSGQPQRQL